MKSGHHWRLLLALLAGCALFLAGCGGTPTESLSPVGTPPKSNTTTAPGDGSSQARETPTPDQPQEVATVEPTQVEEDTMADSANPQIAGLIEQAKEDLSSRLQIGSDRIDLESVEAVQWRDSSLGCPQPGRSYLTVITPGYLLKLTADGQVHEYHTSEGRIVSCNDSTQAFDLSKKPESPLIEEAKADLAHRLDIAVEQIQVLTVASRQWPDASLGCPQPDMMYAQVITPGFQIILSAAGKEYDYRADLQRVFLCQPQ